MQDPFQGQPEAQEGASPGPGKEDEEDRKREAFYADLAAEAYEEYEEENEEEEPTVRFLNPESKRFVQDDEFDHSLVVYPD